MSDKSGRPPIYTNQDVAMDKATVRATNWHFRVYRKVGNGNLSEGFRLLAERYVSESADILPKPNRRD